MFITVVDKCNNSQSLPTEPNNGLPRRGELYNRVKRTNSGKQIYNTWISTAIISAIQSKVYAANCTMHAVILLSQIRIVYLPLRFLSEKMVLQFWNTGMNNCIKIESARASMHESRPHFTTPTPTSSPTSSRGSSSSCRATYPVTLQLAAGITPEIVRVGRVGENPREDVSVGAAVGVVECGL